MSQLDVCYEQSYTIKSLPRKNVIVRSYVLDRGLDAKFEARLPQYGDRTRVIRALIRAFVDGRVNINVPIMRPVASKATP